VIASLFAVGAFGVVALVALVVFGSASAVIDRAHR
jgi:hypothetical protein